MQKLLLVRKVKLFMIKAFTLIEVLIAILIISIGILGAFSLMTFSISTYEETSQKIIEINLARQGIEQIRNLRDNNWRSGIEWNNGIQDKTSNIELNNKNFNREITTTAIMQENELIGFFIQSKVNNTIIKTKLYNWHVQGN